MQTLWKYRAVKHNNALIRPDPVFGLILSVETKHNNQNQECKLVLIGSVFNMQQVFLN